MSESLILKLSSILDPLPVKTLFPSEQPLHLFEVTDRGGALEDRRRLPQLLPRSGTVVGSRRRSIEDRHDPVATPVRASV